MSFLGKKFPAPVGTYSYPVAAGQFGEKQNAEANVVNLEQLSQWLHFSLLVCANSRICWARDLREMRGKEGCIEVGAD